jgi:hypothetical protein
MNGGVKCVAKFFQKIFLRKALAICENMRGDSLSCVMLRRRLTCLPPLRFLPPPQSRGDLLRPSITFAPFSKSLRPPRVHDFGAFGAFYLRLRL